MAVMLLSSFGCEKIMSGYDAGYLEKKLIIPYNITGSLTTVPLGVRSDGAQQETYDVLISAGETSSGVVNMSGDFKIEFHSGDVTDGLTVEFFDDGVFISFDDLRFKTNSDLFTRLELIKNAFAQFSRADVEKIQEDVEPVAGVDLTEISADSEGVKYRALVNKNDGSLIRLTAESDSDKLILDIKQFNNLSDSVEKTSAALEPEAESTEPPADDAFENNDALLLR